MSWLESTMAFLFRMEVYRLSRQKFAQPLSGNGAALRGARWNSIGTELIYTAENRSLAMAEVAVHLSIATLPEDFVLLTIEMPDKVPTKTLEVSDLPDDWNCFPAPESCKKFGDRFVFENEYLLLKIPSVVTQGDYNYLINPRHKDFQQVKIKSIEPFSIDRRLFK
jgi:RES domain-containing protein